jgi:DNA-binding GntR family transcriptional regulator
MAIQLSFAALGDFRNATAVFRGTSPIHTPNGYLRSRGATLGLQYQVWRSIELKLKRANGESGKEGEVDRVYRLLKNGILQCEFRPGDFLAEANLARQCETSRTPVREACNRLSQEGWISSIRHKGYVIPPISIRDIVEIYEYRKLLECFNAEKAAQTASRKQLADLRDIVEVENKRTAKVSDIMAANDVFHLAIAEIAGNRYILVRLKVALEYVHRLAILSTQQNAGWIPHCEILTALETRKAIQAKKAMAAHIDNSRDRMLKLFGV